MKKSPSKFGFLLKSIGLVLNKTLQPLLAIVLRVGMLQLPDSGFIDNWIQQFPFDQYWLNTFLTSCALED
jgi:hypothetical protein